MLQVNSLLDIELEKERYLNGDLNSNKILDKYSELKIDWLALRSANIANNAIIKDLQETIQEVVRQKNKYRDKLFSGIHSDTYSEWSRETSKELEAYIEAMAAAYYKKTNICPSRASLEVSVKDDGKGFYYTIVNRDLVSVPSSIESHPCFS